MNRRIRIISAVCAAGLALTGAAAQTEGNMPGHTATSATNCASYYPPLSRRLNESGTVKIGFDIEADGAITGVRVLRSSGSERLDQAAVDCVSQNLHHAPYLKKGVPVRSPGHMAFIQFALQ